MCTVCVCLLTCGDNDEGSRTRGARFQGHLKGSGIMQYPVGVFFFLKSALRLMTNILYAFIMYMYMYGFLNAFKIKLLEILLIK